NPVVLGPSQSNINFGAAAATPKMTALPPLRVNQNTPIGPITFTVSDQDTPLSALTFSATSDNVNLVAPKDVLFTGSGANRAVSGTPGTTRTGTATLKLSVSDPEGNVSTQDWVVTVNAPPAITAPAIRGDEDTIFTIDLRSIATDA